MTIWVFLVIVTVTYLIFFLVVSSKDYNEREQKIKKITDKWERDFIDTDKITITPIEIRPNLNNKEYFIYLEVFNGENIDLRDCYANLESVRINYGNDDDYNDYSKYITINNSSLNWVKFDDQEVVIRRNKTEKIRVASYFPEGSISLLLQNEAIAIPNEKYYLEISVNGTLNNKPIKEKLFMGIIKLDSEIVQSGETIIVTTDESGKKIEKIPSIPIRIFQFYLDPCEKIINESKEE